jgi:hypothetical protein
VIVQGVRARQEEVGSNGGGDRPNKRFRSAIRRRGAGVAEPEFSNSSGVMGC